MAKKSETPAVTTTYDASTLSMTITTSLTAQPAPYESLQGSMSVTVTHVHPSQRNAVAEDQAKFVRKALRDHMLRQQATYAGGVYAALRKQNKK